MKELDFIVSIAENVPFVDLQLRTVNEDATEVWGPIYSDWSQLDFSALPQNAGAQIGIHFGRGLDGETCARQYCAGMNDREWHVAVLNEICDLHLCPKLTNMSEQAVQRALATAQYAGLPVTELALELIRALQRGIEQTNLEDPRTGDLYAKLYELTIRFVAGARPLLDPNQNDLLLESVVKLPCWSPEQLAQYLASCDIRIAKKHTLTQQALF